MINFHFPYSLQTFVNFHTRLVLVEQAFRNGISTQSFRNVKPFTMEDVKAMIIDLIQKRNANRSAVRKMTTFTKCLMNLMMNSIKQIKMINFPLLKNTSLVSINTDLLKIKLGYVYP